MAAIHPAIPLDGYPDELIDSTEAAIRFIERYDGDKYDLEATALTQLLRSVETPESAHAATEAFRDWAESLGLLSGTTTKLDDPEAKRPQTLPGPPSHERDFKEALGSAVVELWAELPRPIQERLFEHAVFAGHHLERDESLRQELARYLHDQNPRTARPQKP
jgi:hypothetical protein